MQRLATEQDFTTFLAEALDRVLHGADRLGAYQRTHQRVRQARVADPHIPVGRGQPPDELVANGFVHDDAAGTRAALAGRAHGAK